MAAPTNIWYTDIGAVQAGGVNILANLDDPNLTAGRVKLITGTYTMTGNEVANDAIYIARIPSGSLVDPTSGNVATNGAATGGSATLLIGDTDTQGGTVAYDPARYSGSIDVHAANTTTGVAFTGGTVMKTPAAPEIVDDWVWLIATFATLGTPSANNKLIFRIRVSSLD
jgi:hypothetical protein